MSEMSSGYFTPFDGVVLAVYFIAVVMAGLYSMRTRARGNVSGYFLGGRMMTWLPVGASLFASNIGSQHFIGLAGSGAAAGVAMGAFEFNAMLALVLLGYLFLPVYIAASVCTLPEYLQKRFGGKRIQVYISLLSIFLYVFTKISVNLFAGSIIIEQALHWSLWPSVLLLLAATCLVALTGGLAAVIYTDTAQTFLMLIGSTILMVISYSKVGGIEGLYERYPLAIAANSTPSTCSLPREDAFIMLRGFDSDLPWLAYLLGASVDSMWYWCTDQVIVQRTLSAKSLSHAQGATVFCAAIKVLPMFMMVIPGMISRTLYPDILACGDAAACELACGSRLGCSNLAYPLLVLRLLPSGLRGLLVAVMLGALMTDLCSVFNSASSLITLDLYPLLRPKPTNAELMVVGRVSVLALVAVSVCWIPIIQANQGGQLYVYIQAITGYLAPPIAAVYLLAVVWPRSNETGAVAALFLSLLVGTVRICVDLAFAAPECGAVDERPESLRKFHFLYFAFFLFSVTMLVNVVVSLLTPPGDAWRLIRTTVWTRHDTAVRPDETSQLVQEDQLAAESEQQVLDVRSLSRKYAGEGEALPLGGMGEELRVEHEPDKEVPGRSLWSRCFDVWCGTESPESSPFNTHAEVNVASLEQSPQQKYFITASFIAIIVVCVSFHILFMVPWYGTNLPGSLNITSTG